MAREEGDVAVQNVVEASVGKATRKSLRDVKTTLGKKVDEFTESMKGAQGVLELKNRHQGKHDSLGDELNGGMQVLEDRMSSLLNQVVEDASKQSNAIEVMVVALRREMLAEVKQLKIELDVTPRIYG
ncbi:hypothetical protein V6N12_029840 [Hibiscus sabdariffa]|uniref:Uncharacterized protein n=1 Tax=Hibiscus sabdariffa TaxID=183260 RepID=A0ABR2CXB1_9ROSI